MHWYKHNGRNLPWRQTNDPYKIWVSEIFLQQTQVNRVIEYYEKMLKKYPTVKHLAKSDWEEFFPYFKGLGFYSRGKNMLLCSQTVVELHNSVFVNNPKILQSLPGIGEYTAHAIASFAYKNPVPALDVNLYRVLGRVLDVHENITTVAFDYFAKQTGEHCHVFNHALMDIGSQFCTAKKIDCENCPLQNECLFLKKNKKLTKIIKVKKITKSNNSVNNKTISVFMLRNNKKYLLERDINSENIWKFPEFLQELNTSDAKNNRHFLQKIIQEKFEIEISVRPVFWKEEYLKNTQRVLYKFARCQIQSGEKQFLERLEDNNINNKKYKFFTIGEIIELYKNKNFTYYSQEFYTKIISMRI